MSERVLNTPNASKLISSLRSTGYNDSTAIEDIIDNSIDAGAEIIRIFWDSPENERRIIITDNGDGMDFDTLDQALKLGSISDKNPELHLGKYGMWLCTASISIWRCLEVITRTADGETYYSKQDLDEIEECNEFYKILREATNNEKDYLNKHLWNDHSWTAVIISKIDRIKDTNAKQFESSLGKSIWRKYRRFLDNGILISVNGHKVMKEDPLMLEHEETEVYCDEVYNLPDSINEGIKDTAIGVKIVLLPEFSPEVNAERKINLRSQGFYVLRNDREIATATTLKVYTRHGDFNRMRIEVSFSSQLDELFWVRFNKDGVDPKEALIGFLKTELNGQIGSIRNKIKRLQKASPEMQLDHSESEEIIAKRAGQLITPEAEIEKRNSSERTKREKSEVQPRDSDRIRNEFRKTQTSPQWLGASFETACLWREGVLYECEQKWKIIVIRWNSDHPFYERILLEHKWDKSVTTGMDFLIYSLASAELKSANEENIELISNIKAIMSSNLRTLMG